MSKVGEFLKADSATFEQTVQALREISNSPGAAPLHAAWRGGLKDIQDALIPAFPESMHPREEPGSIASPTPQLVTENITGREMNMNTDQLGKTTLADMRGDTAAKESKAPAQNLTMDDLRGIAADKAKEAEQTMDRGREGIER